MTTEDRERSWDSGEPIVLYEFIRGTRHWRYTNVRSAQEVLAQTYEPAAGIEHTEIEIGPERRKLGVTITLPAGLEVVDNWRPYPSSDAVAVVIHLLHAGETQPLVEWMGRVVQPRFRTDGMLELTGEPRATRASRTGLRRCWGRGCGVPLYSGGRGMCNVDRNAHAVAATVIGVNGLTVEAAAFGTFPDGRLAGGDLEWVRPDGNIERRSISSHSGTFVTVDFGATDLAAGLAVSVAPGCAHNTDDCANFYNNMDNYGGDPYMPERSHYDGNPVW